MLSGTFIIREGGVRETCVLKRQLRPEEHYSSYVDESASPETEKPPSLKFRYGCRVGGHFNDILFACYLGQFDTKHIETHDHLG